MRTGQSGDSDAGDEQAAELLVDIFKAWEDPMRAVVTDPVQAEIIRLVGFGLYLGDLVGLPRVDPVVLASVFDRVLADQSAAPARITAGSNSR